jgi:hypothetical protein
MRVHSLIFLGGVSALAAAASACSHNVVNGQTGTTGGSGGSTTVVTTTTVKDAGPDVDEGMVSSTYPAFMPDVPSVLSGGGPTMSAPKIVPVFFAGDSYQAQITDFVSKIGKSKWWEASTIEYGVGAATAGPAVALTEAAPASIDDNGIQSWLVGNLEAGAVDGGTAWPAADDNTIYMIHYPASSSITLSMGGQTAHSCTEFGGYHNSTTLTNGQNVVYAVVPTCGGLQPGLSGLDELTGAASHELVEAATDPLPEIQGMQAYGQVDQAHLIWELALGGGETGDMCAQFPGSFYKFPDIGYTVQRGWSNLSAAGYHDPCVPELPNEVYFNAAPVFPDQIDVGFGPISGVKIPVGSSKTIELDMFSEAATGGPWNVDVIDLDALMGGGATLGFSLDRSSGQNGEKLHLTIDALSQGQYGVGVFIVVSHMGQFNQTNPQQHWWIGLVGH